MRAPLAVRAEHLEGFLSTRFLTVLIPARNDSLDCASVFAGSVNCSPSPELRSNIWELNSGRTVPDRCVGCGFLKLASVEKAVCGVWFVSLPSSLTISPIVVISTRSTPFSLSTSYISSLSKGPKRTRYLCNLIQSGAFDGGLALFGPLATEST